MDTDYVTGFPFSGYCEVSISSELAVSLLAIDGNGVAEAFAIGIVIKVGGHGLPFHPSGDTNLQPEQAGFVLTNLDSDITIPRVTGVLAQCNLLSFNGQIGRVAEEEVHIDVAVFHGIDIAGKRRQEPADVAWAAGTAEPRLTLVLPHALQWVGIEETAAVHAHTVDEAVVERTLQDVEIFALAMEEEESVVHIDIADGCAGLIVSAHVRQLIVGSEGFAVACGADATRDIELLRYDIVPDAVYGMDVSRVTGQRCHISHTGIHVCGTYGMADGFALFEDGYVTL